MPQERYSGPALRRRLRDDVLELRLGRAFSHEHQLDPRQGGARVQYGACDGLEALKPPDVPGENNAKPIHVGGERARHGRVRRFVIGELEVGQNHDP